MIDFFGSRSSSRGVYFFLFFLPKDSLHTAAPDYLRALPSTPAHGMPRGRPRGQPRSSGPRFTEQGEQVGECYQGSRYLLPSLAGGLLDAVEICVDNGARHIRGIEPSFSAVIVSITLINKV